MSIKTCGFSFTSQRNAFLINESNESKHRKKKRFYDWMVLGDYVSYKLYVYF